MSWSSPELGLGHLVHCLFLLKGKNHLSSCSCPLVSPFAAQRVTEKSLDTVIRSLLRMKKVRGSAGGRATPWGALPHLPGRPGSSPVLCFLLVALLPTLIVEPPMGQTEGKPWA